MKSSFIFIFLFQKRICKRLETVPQEIRTCYPLSTYAVDFWDMEQDLNQKDPTELFSPQNTRKKPNSMVLYVLCSPNSCF